MEEKYIIATQKDFDIVRSCEKFARDNSEKNMGLTYWPYIDDADYLVCLYQNEHIKGYASLKKLRVDADSKKNLEISFVASEKRDRDNDVRFKLVNFILHHSREYKYVVSPLHLTVDEGRKLIYGINFGLKNDDLKIYNFADKFIIDTDCIDNNKNLNETIKEQNQKKISEVTSDEELCREA